MLTHQRVRNFTLNNINEKFTKKLLYGRYYREKTKSKEKRCIRETVLRLTL